MSARTSRKLKGKIMMDLCSLLSEGRQLKLITMTEKKKLRVQDKSHSQLQFQGKI